MGEGRAHEAGKEEASSSHHHSRGSPSETADLKARLRQLQKELKELNEENEDCEQR